MYFKQSKSSANDKSFCIDFREEYVDSLSFHVPQTDLKWSAMFGLMESYKEKLNIEDYSLGQTTLEQVFLFFTKYQRIVD